ncbi:hypothetical protein ACFYOY_36205 [Streptomyces sp. NPDC007875]|uniref:hypothetical protein n=1 Tax=Streptomyces sp. NPDC007875 TaxID=3364783 RepID=UPI00367DC492
MADRASATSVKDETEELWNANQVAKVLDVSATEIGRRLRGGEPPRPRFHAGSAKTALWVPTEVRLFAAQRGQALADGPLRRLPVPMWLDLPALEAPLPRVTDQVMDFSVPWSQDQYSVHVRIWRGPADGGERIVCLISAMDVRTLYPTVGSHGQHIAEEIVAAGLLTPDDARRCFFFGLGVRAEPFWSKEEGPQSLVYLTFAVPEQQTGLLGRWRRPDTRLFTPAGASVIRAGLPQLAHLVGEDVELYPEGTHTRETIERYVGGERPVALEWDPDELVAHVERTKVLREWAVQLQKAGELRAAAIAVDAATTTANAAVMADTRYHHSYFKEERTTVDRRCPQLTRDQRDELAAFGADFGGDNIAHWLRLHRAAAALRDSAGIEGPVREALVAACAENDATLPIVVRAAAQKHGGWPLQLTVDEHPELADYVGTLAWYGPKDEDQELAELLVSALWEDEREGARAAYDPFGRLVLVTAARDVVAVACPAAQGAIHRLDQPHPGCVALPDGRIDLMQMEQTGPNRIRLA